jgi:hypothetical protein
MYVFCDDHNSFFGVQRYKVFKRRKEKGERKKEKDETIKAVRKRRKLGIAISSWQLAVGIRQLAYTNL